MKCRITKDKDDVYQAQTWDGCNWLYEPGTTSLSEEETEKLLLSIIAPPKPTVVKEWEI